DFVNSRAYTCRYGDDGNKKQVFRYWQDDKKMPHGGMRRKMARIEEMVYFCDHVFILFYLL
ncbi:hypothetical protein L3204_004679, partial [Escherichia coli]